MHGGKIKKKPGIYLVKHFRLIFLATDYATESSRVNLFYPVYVQFTNDVFIIINYLCPYYYTVLCIYY